MAMKGQSQSKSSMDVTTLMVKKATVDVIKAPVEEVAMVVVGWDKEKGNSNEEEIQESCHV